MDICYLLFSIIAVFNLANAASVAERSKISKSQHQLADTRAFPFGDYDYDDIPWAILPGTNWCGYGHITPKGNGSELGTYVNVDKCCRTHDHCPRILERGESGFGTVNDGKYIARDCKCDDKFNSCLKQISGKDKFAEMQRAIANLAGTMFFNVLKMKCLDFKTSSKKAVLADAKSFSMKKTT